MPLKLSLVTTPRLTSSARAFSARVFMQTGLPHNIKKETGPFIPQDRAMTSPASLLIAVRLLRYQQEPDCPIRTGSPVAPGLSVYFSPARPVAVRQKPHHQQGDTCFLALTILAHLSCREKLAPANATTQGITCRARQGHNRAVCQAGCRFPRLRLGH